jgi:hypothetical protein
MHLVHHQFKHMCHSTNHMVLQTFGLFLQQLLPICLNLARRVHAIKPFLTGRFGHPALVMALGV